MIVAGLQVPVILLFEVPGSTGGVVFCVSGPICVNVGVICVAITIVIVVAVAHCVLDGVNVYVIDPSVAVLIVPGVHVPATLLVDVAGRAGAVLF